ncbi:MAG: hypothetical protein U1F83_14155 [Verrucomicrobiota bacterium]
MKKFVFGIFVGVTISAIVFIPVLVSERRNKFEYGLRHGGMSAQLDIARRLPESLGHEISPDECTNKFLEVKDAIIWVVERNGVKTLRTY